MINMTGLLPPGTPVEILLVDYYGRSQFKSYFYFNNISGSPLYSNPASPTKTNPHMYFVGPFVPPKGLFFVQVKGVDDKVSKFKQT